MTSELIDRLRAATEGSQELDARIWLAVTPGATRKDSSYIHQASGQLCVIDETRDGTGRLIIVPHYTTSLDAALTLVPEGWTRAVDATAPEMDIDVDLFGPDKKRVMGRHESEIIATCIAALLALESQA